MNWVLFALQALAWGAVGWHASYLRRTKEEKEDFRG